MDLTFSEEEYTTGPNGHSSLKVCILMSGNQIILYPFPKLQISDFSKLKEFADNNVQFNDDG